MGFRISQNVFQVLAQTCDSSMAQGEKLNCLKSLLFYLCDGVITPEGVME